MESIQAIKVRIDYDMPIAIQADALTVIYINEDRGI
jgi:hypothetical protein